MIQRIQSVFLALVLVLFVIMLFMPVYTITYIHESNVSLNKVTFPAMLSLPYLMYSDLVISIIALITIFMYKNRKKQIMISKLGMLLSLVLIILVISFPALFSGAFLITKGNFVVSYGIGVYLLLLNVIFFFLASRSIKKDEDLVKAADRLR